MAFDYQEIKKILTYLHQRSDDRIRSTINLPTWTLNNSRLNALSYDGMTYRKSALIF